MKEERVDYERQKGELVLAMETEEAERHAKEMRESRNRTIEAEVEARRLRAEREKVAAAIVNDDREYHAKADELSRVKRQLIQQKDELKQEVLA